MDSTRWRRKHIKVMKDFGVNIIVDFFMFGHVWYIYIHTQDKMNIKFVHEYPIHLQTEIHLPNRSLGHRV